MQEASQNNNGRTAYSSPTPWSISGIRTRESGEPVLQILDAEGRPFALVFYSDRTVKDHVASYADARLIAAATDMAEAIAFSKVALAALAGLERDLGELPDDHEIGRIDDSRDSPSFRIRVGHIRKMAAAFERATGAEHSVRGDAVTPQL